MWEFADGRACAVTRTGTRAVLARAHAGTHAGARAGTRAGTPRTHGREFSYEKACGRWRGHSRALAWRPAGARAGACPGLPAQLSGTLVRDIVPPVTWGLVRDIMRALTWGLGLARADARARTCAGTHAGTCNGTHVGTPTGTRAGTYTGTCAGSQALTQVLVRPLRGTRHTFMK